MKLNLTVGYGVAWHPMGHSPRHIPLFCGLAAARQALRQEEPLGSAQGPVGERPPKCQRLPESGTSQKQETTILDSNAQMASIMEP